MDRRTAQAERSWQGFGDARGSITARTTFPIPNEGLKWECTMRHAHGRGFHLDTFHSVMNHCYSHGGRTRLDSGNAARLNDYGHGFAQ